MYKYEDERDNIFTEQGQRRFLMVRDHVHKLLDRSGAITMGKALEAVTGDSWEGMAYVDRMVELDEIREIIPSVMPAGQDRIFVKFKGL